MATYFPTRIDPLVDTDIPDLKVASKCLEPPCLSERQRQAVNVVLLNYLIAGLLSDDLLSTEELMALNACYKCMGSEELSAIRTAALWEFAQEYGLATPTVAGTLVNEAVCLSCSNVDMEPLLTALLIRLINALHEEITPPEPQ